MMLKYLKKIARLCLLALLLQGGAVSAAISAETEIARSTRPVHSPISKPKTKRLWASAKFFPKFLLKTARNLVRPRSLKVLAITAVASYTVSRFNQPISQSLQNPSFQNYTAFGRESYAPLINRSLPQFSTYALGFALKNNRIIGTGYTLLGAFFLDRISVGLLQFSTRDRRPDPRVQSNPTGGTFPSGHASGSAAFAGVIQARHGWKAALPFHAGALYTGVTRVADSAHRPHEVVAGLGLGYAIGLAAEEAWTETEMNHPDLVLFPQLDPQKQEYGLALKFRF